MKIKKMRYFLVVVMIVIFFNSCKKNTYYICSPDEKQCITVKNYGKTRYLINGKHESIPDNEYIKLDISKIDKISDAVHICWKDEEYDWNIVIDKSIIIESKIDTSKYHFRTRLPLNDKKIPSELEFRHDFCTIYSFSLNRLTPNNGAIVK